MVSVLDLTGQQILYGIFAATVIISTHGFFVVLISRLLGDPGPAYDGRLTLNPFAHAEPVGALVLAFTRIGWIAPVDIEPDKLKGRIAGIVAIIATSLAASLVLAKLLWMMRPLVFSLLPGNAVGTTLIGLLETTAEASIQFVVLNLIPFPPLTAGLLLAGLAPRAYRWLTSHVFIPATALATLAVFGVVSAFLDIPTDRLAAWLLN